MICLCLSIQVAMATDNKSTDVSKNKRLQIGISLTPSVTYHTIILKKNLPPGPSGYDYLRKYTRPQYGHTIGLDIVYILTANVAIQTGCKYSMKSYRLNSEPNHYNTISYSTIYQYHFTEIPLAARFNAGKKAVRFTGRIGVEANFLLGETQITLANNKPNGYNPRLVHFPAYDNPRIFTMSALVSAGIDYKVSAKMGVRLEPYFSHQFIPFTGTDLKTYLWSAGLDCTFYFGGNNSTH